MAFLLFLSIWIASCFGIGAGAAMGQWYGWGMFSGSLGIWVFSLASIIGIALEQAEAKE